MSDLEEKTTQLDQEQVHHSSDEQHHEEEHHHEDDYDEEGEEDGEEGYGSGSESEYEEVNITENPLYQVLSVFFEDDNGRNLCDKLDDVREAINRNTQVQHAILKQLTGSGGSSADGKNRQQQKRPDRNRRK